MATKKPPRGRQKIKMTKINDLSHRQVTFSKRRLGVFKKASEICTLCGVQAIIIVFSPGNRIFSFGHPNVESVVDCYLYCNPLSCPPQTTSSNTKNKNVDVGQNSTLNTLNSQITKTLDLLAIEKNKGEVLKNLLRKSSQWWWEAPIDNLGLHELEVLGVSLEDLKKSIASQVVFLENQRSNMANNAADFEARIVGFAYPHQVGSIHALKFL
ncbi:agamous-like MADS-box protein AGL62 [Amaranthus tricolor]|uniref:agamous-like MADS-box protein AGL62 n=1 Tax=Amaranthus tricolor TaxID=29722 RepID=UPI00258DACEB|nr:agamous-like MADS-box protein AGL62 [Amaranthus tricolor]